MSTPVWQHDLNQTWSLLNQHSLLNGKSGEDTTRGCCASAELSTVAALDVGAWCMAGQGAARRLAAILSVYAHLQLVIREGVCSLQGNSRTLGQLWVSHWEAHELAMATGCMLS